MPKHRNSTSFKIGSTPWNKQNQIRRLCKYCGKEFIVNEGALSFRPCLFCDASCKRKYQIGNSRYKDLVKERKSGKTVKELAQQYGVTTITINSYLNRLGYRSPQGHTYISIRNRILKQKEKKCVICGFERIVELAHYIRASRGGAFTPENTIVLCPNHHRLFDANKLNEFEKNQLKKVAIYESGGLEIAV